MIAYRTNKSNPFLSLFITFTILMGTVVSYADYSGPQYVFSSENAKWSSMSESQREKENQEIFSRYCSGRANDTDVPFVNYKNDDVMRAAQKLSGLEYNAFYFYGGPARAYGLRTKEYDLYRDYTRNVFVWVESGADIPKEVKKQIDDGSIQLVSGDKKKRAWYDPRNKSKPKEISDPAHALLVQLCGEFRDRATMIEAKINWFQRIIQLPTQDQAFDPRGDLWTQFSANDYSKFLEITSAGWEAKREFQDKIQDKKVKPLPEVIDGAHLGPIVQLLNAGRRIEIGDEKHDVPVPALTVCEAKYIQAEFVRKNKNPWEDGDATKTVPDYLSGLAEFQNKNCSGYDVSYYYDFRGDSNIKHYSPESNGMIWHASSVAGNCSSTTRASHNQSGAVKQSDRDCENYFRRPFASRWNAARAGLATWLSYDKDNEANFRNDNSMVAVFPYEGKNPRYVNPSQEPYSYTFDVNSTEAGSLEKGIDLRWNKVKDAFGLVSLGLTEMFDYKSEDGRYSVFNRLRNAVNRHTNWYQSGFNDGRGLLRAQAYSPFVASSYEPSESNAFTAPGYTVQGDADGRKYLMYVFRIPVANWLHSLSVKSGGAINLDTAWLDETSIGDTSLAESEKAFDRLGTALEGELDSILYLHNIEHESGGVTQSAAPLVYSK